MVKVCKQNKNSVMTKMLNGKVDAVYSSSTDLVDDIILAMHNKEILKCIENGIPDKRADNTVIPFNLFLALSISAKMKIKTSLSDIPFAIQDHRVLAELGYALIDTENGLNNGLMRESGLRFILNKYSQADFIQGYSETVQNYIMPKLNMTPNIHILDCTKLEVFLKNQNYEGSAVGRDSDGKKARGYKLATIRGISGDNGIIEDIRFGAIDIHDLELSRDMLYNSPVLKNGDTIINDKGFISRDVMNYLKNNRGVDTCIPLKTNMKAFKTAVATAKTENKWVQHPNKKRKTQKIAFVGNLGGLWKSDNKENDVDFSSCVVWETTTDEYFVFVSTNLTLNAKQIISTYELRPEIEEDYRQLKDFWKLEDFKSTKLNFIAFHIICTLFGYLFFQIYTMLPERQKYANKCLPVVLKNYVSKAQNYIVLYVDNEFGIFDLHELRT